MNNQPSFEQELFTFLRKKGYTIEECNTIIQLGKHAYTGWRRFVICSALSSALYFAREYGVVYHTQDINEIHQMEGFEFRFDISKGFNQVIHSISIETKRAIQYLSQEAIRVIDQVVKDEHVMDHMMAVFSGVVLGLCMLDLWNSIPGADNGYVISYD
eukprot:TRINITY_DN2893_c0_g1_i1.p1 TRINITY_DN2893_c0_g1~~TRINITY_DN2893_c0_g1_i1.p1  ORF type:complete len:158 (-),score=22.31 TRINITY_DN2893_c0_g1_i1:30-503(-)